MKSKNETALDDFFFASAARFSMLKLEMVSNVAFYSQVMHIHIVLLRDVWGFPM